MTECEYYNKKHCLSCSLLGEPDFDKEASFSEAAKKHFGGNLSIKPISTPSSYLPSRLRAKLSVSGDIENPVIGLLDKSFKGIELCSCPLHFPEINDLLIALPSFIHKHELPPYNIEERSGELKGVIVRSAADRESLLLRFVLRSEKLLPQLKRVIFNLTEQFPLLKCVTVNIQPVPHQIVEGEKEVLIFGEEILWEQLGDLKLAFHPQSFSQVTKETAEELYSYASTLTKGSKSIIDLYCGVGGFLLSCSKGLEWGKGVEISEASINCAKLAAAHLPQLVFSAEDVSSWLESYCGEAPEVVIVNPPRRGISAECVSFLKRLQPAQIIYSSCNPETLFRDIELLQSNYQLLSLKPFDMFPLTKHLEVVAHLSSL